jgi:hypothetical protein
MDGTSDMDSTSRLTVGRTAADRLIETIHDWGVDVVFGLPLAVRQPRHHGARAIAAQVAHPGRQCVAFVGGGGLSMLMAEFATCVKYRLPVKAVIVENNTLGQIKWEQMVFLGNPEYGCELHPIDLVKHAETCGGRGFRIEHPAECGRVLDEALAAPGPVIVEGIVDPLKPPMPRRSPWPRPPTSPSPGARRAEPEEDRPHRPGRQGAGARLRAPRFAGRSTSPACARSRGSAILEPGTRARCLIVDARPDDVSARCVHPDSFTARHGNRSFVGELQGGDTWQLGGFR